MKILVAGGAGFIGSHLCQKLLQRGDEVVCVDNFLTGTKDNLKDFIDHKNFLLIEKDVCKRFEIKKKIDAVFHLASPASPNPYSPISYHKLWEETARVNSIGLFNLISLALKHDALFLFTSSSEVYGEPEVHPQREDYWGRVNPLGPRAIYDEGKRFAEAVIINYVKKKGLNGRIVRVFNTYGPRMREDDQRMVVNFIISAIENKPIRIFGDGQATRSLCFVEDLVEGLIRSMFFPQTKGEVFNLGSDDERKVLDYALIIRTFLASESPIIFEESLENDPKRRKPDLTKAKKILGWTPKTPLELGLKKTIEFYKLKSGLKKRT